MDCLQNLERTEFVRKEVDFMLDRRIKFDERYDSEDGVLFLPKVISRKQQLIPLISSILE